MIALLAVSNGRAESFKSWAARGAREEREKDPKAAFSSYSNALSMWDEGDGNAGKAKVLCARAGLREKEGDEKGALSDFSGCLELDKKNAKAFHRRGVMLLKAGKIPAAIGDFYKAVALDIRFAQAYADRARAYEAQGEIGFAREDYKQACSLGVKPACAKAKELVPGKATPKAVATTKASAPEPLPTEKPAPPAPPAPAAPAPKAEKPPTEPKGEGVSLPPAVEKGPPAPKKKTPPAYHPRFSHCLEALEACVEKGDSFGFCVRASPSCDKKAVKGCCPASCLKAYQKALNRDRSEAQAYREHFTPESACGQPPKESDDD